MTNAARLAKLAALSAQSVPTAPAAEFFILDFGSTCLCEMPFTSLRIALLFLSVSLHRLRRALAQSGSAGGTIGNDEKSLSGSRKRHGRLRPRHGAANPRRRHRIAHRGRAAAATRFRWRVDCELRRRHVFGQQQQRGRRHQRQDNRSDRQRHRQSRRQGVWHPSGNGITVITVGRLSGRSGGGTFRQSDGCTGRWTAAKQ